MTESCICGGIFDLASKEARVKELETQMERSEFWNDNEHAQRIIAESNELKAWTAPCEQLKTKFRRCSAHCCRKPLN